MPAPFGRRWTRRASRRSRSRLVRQLLEPKHPQQTALDPAAQQLLQLGESKLRKLAAELLRGERRMLCPEPAQRVLGRGRHLYARRYPWSVTLVRYRDRYPRGVRLDARVWRLLKSAFWFDLRQPLLERQQVRYHTAGVELRGDARQLGE